MRLEATGAAAIRSNKSSRKVLQTRFHVRVVLQLEIKGVNQQQKLVASHMTEFNHLTVSLS